MKFVLSSKVYQPIVYIALGIICYKVLSRILKKLYTKNMGNIDRRKDTIISLVRNISKYLITIFIILSILNVYGIDTSKIIASLGIAAAVIGLAFQDIIKDFLAGILIIFDNKYAVGDIVKINDFTGEVISLGLMNTRIKSYTGEVKVLANSSFNEVINYSFSNSMLVIDIPVAYNTNIDKLESILLSMKEDILKIDNVINYNLLGLNEFKDSSLIYQIEIECKPYTYFGVKRKVLLLLKNILDKNKIEIPYNKLDINIRKDK